MGSYRQVREDKMLAEACRKFYLEGYDAGKRAALLQAQIQIREVALRSRANRHECQYENLVVMLRDVDKILTTLMED
jgi:hypothetical protein